MQFGISIRTIGQQLPSREARDYYLEFSKAAEELGFSTLWGGDHIVVPHAATSRYPYRKDGVFVYSPDNAYWEPLTVFAAIAAVTQRIRLATSVLVLPIRHPILAAKVIATIDCLSNGRFTLGAGVGWLKEEMQLLGAPTVEHLGALTDEYIRIFKELWTKDEPRFEGRWFRFSGFSFLPKPVQKPHPPIWIGGITDAALKRVVRLGDGWRSPPQTAEGVASCIQRLRQFCQQEGRPFQQLTLSTNSWIVVDKDARGSGEAEMLGLENSISPTIRGNPDQIARTLRRYRAAGITDISGAFTIKGGAPGLKDSLKAAQIVAKEIMPQVE